MQLIVAIIILILMALFALGFAFFIFAWLRKNNLLVEYSTRKDGSYVLSSFRGRIQNNRIYSIRQFFPKYTKPLCHPEGMPVLVYSGKPDDNGELIKESIVDLTKYIISIESNPLFGIRRVLKLKIIHGRYFPMSIPDIHNANISGFTPNDIAWMHSTREILYTETENKMSKEELIYKLGTNIGLILLAICLLIFYPKIHAAVVQPALNSLSQGSTGWVDALKGAKVIP